jgi:hypothetical protein
LVSGVDGRQRKDEIYGSVRESRLCERQGHERRDQRGMFIKISVVVGWGTVERGVATSGRCTCRVAAESDWVRDREGK